MKEKLKHIFSPRSVIIWVFILIVIATIPEFTEPAMSQTEAIVNMLCIEKVGEKNFKVATSVLTPAKEKESNYQIYSGSGETVGEAVENVSLAIGKEMGFAQCEIMAFGNNICEDGILSSLDYLTRTRKVGRNAILINFTGDGTEFAQTVSNLSKEKTLKLENIMNFDKRYILSRDSNIDSFYKGYFSEISLGIMPQVKLENSEKDNSIEVQASSTDNSTSLSKNQENKYLLNDGTMSVFKKGKKVLEIEPSMVQKINLFLNLSQEGTLKVENVTDEIYNNATIVFDLSNKSISLKPEFKNNKPIYNVEIDLTILVEEVMEEQPNTSFLRRNKEFLTPTAIEKLKDTIQSEMQTVIAFCKEHKIDLLNVYRQFNRKKYKDFQTYYHQ
ncbi:MAG: hypothetical protein IJD48_00490, partial [Clostridia bacterium]|nr:hypothetical protein [Clostridia bacterium]